MASAKLLQNLSAVAKVKSACLVCNFGSRASCSCDYGLMGSLERLGMEKILLPMLGHQTIGFSCNSARFGSTYSLEMLNVQDCTVAAGKKTDLGLSSFCEDL